MPLAEAFGDSEGIPLWDFCLPTRRADDTLLWLHHTTYASPCCALLTSLDPRQLFLRSSSRRLPLNAWSWQDLMVNFVRVRDRNIPLPRIYHRMLSGS